MPTKLTIAQQRALLRALPMSRRNAVKRHCRACQMKGQGIKEILKSIGAKLGPIAKEFGPTVLKELVIPFLLKQAGGGLTPAGGALKVYKRKRKKI